MTYSSSRRTVLTAGIAAVVTGLTACTAEPRPRQDPPSGDNSEMTPTPGATTGSGARVLLVYFSRPWENYYYGDRVWLDVGNTEVLASMITDRITADTYKIEAAEPYPQDYDATVERNNREQQDNARPTIANPLPDVSDYETVLIGSPVWGTRAPMIISTFIEGVDLAGKTVLPFVTYAVSGMSGVDHDYRDALPDTEVRDGLAIRGGTVTDREVRTQNLDAWLNANSLTRERKSDTQ